MVAYDDHYMRTQLSAREVANLRDQTRPVFETVPKHVAEMATAERAEGRAGKRRQPKAKGSGDSRGNTGHSSPATFFGAHVSSPLPMPLTR